MRGLVPFDSIGLSDRCHNGSLSRGLIAQVTRSDFSAASLLVVTWYINGSVHLCAGRGLSHRSHRGKCSVVMGCRLDAGASVCV